MTGKVFISCGQRRSTDNTAGVDEREIAECVARILKEQFNLDTYLSLTIQSADDIMQITKELCACDYFLFIDFLRNPQEPSDFKNSLFSHQEFALAHHLGFGKNIIAFQHSELRPDGFMRYTLTNPEKFHGKDDLLEKIPQLIKDRGWVPTYSRNLVISGLEEPGRSITYTDHSGTFNEKVWRIQIKNRRPDVAAERTVCILDYVIRKRDDKRITPFDRSLLKWAGQVGYEKTILPEDAGSIDLFAVHMERPGLFLHSSRDTPREPILSKNGEYELFFKVFSQGFPLVRFGVEMNLMWKKPTPTQWHDTSAARIV